jgi:hypothetical protein
VAPCAQARAGPGLLTLHAEAPDPGSLARIQDLVAGRLEKFGRREQLTVTWQAAQAPGSAPSPDTPAGR